MGDDHISAIIKLIACVKDVDSISCDAATNSFAHCQSPVLIKHESPLWPSLLCMIHIHLKPLNCKSVDLCTNYFTAGHLPIDD
jgi:hypothetical protein